MKLNEEIHKIKKMMGLITENIDSIKDELGDDVPLTVEDYVDSEDPLCTLPQTGDPEEDNILNKVWEWSQQQSVETLRDMKKTIKKTISKVKKEEVNEQVTPVIVIGTVAISATTLIIIGWIVLVIIVLSIINKRTKRQSPCKRRRKLVKKHGMDGYFM